MLSVVTHDANSGYGAALKTALRVATTDLIAITDADGTYPNEMIPELARRCETRDMVVGARIGPGVVYSRVRAFPKLFLKRWVSWIAGRHVPDINSGLRVFRRDIAERFFGIYPDGFSFTITITLAMLTTRRKVDFVPISYATRVGQSKIRPIKDTIRFINIILRTGIYFAPLRAFSPLVILLGIGGLASLASDLYHRDLTEATLLLFLFMLNAGMFMLLADMIDKRANL
jgi:glycosyltransferase involved in cell wall biosynthesis